MNWYKAIKRLPQIVRCLEQLCNDLDFEYRDKNGDKQWEGVNEARALLKEVAYGA